MSLTSGTAVALLTALGLVVGTTGARAQAGTEPNLSTVKSLKCTFSSSTRGAWTKDGAPDPRVRMSGVLTLEMTEIDAAGGLAMLSNTAGKHDVTVQLDGRTLHFLEVSRGGRIAMTTVFASYSTGTRLKAAHTRTDYLPIDLGTFKSEPEVSQYFGDCEAKP